MNWLIELVSGTGVAHAIFIYSLVIALGVILGKQKIFGVSLGATFVLFMGILAGHLGLTVDPIPQSLTDSLKLLPCSVPSAVCLMPTELQEGFFCCRLKKA